jgi:hypothetical protein
MKCTTSSFFILYLWSVQQLLVKGAHTWELRKKKEVVNILPFQTFIY